MEKNNKKIDVDATMAKIYDSINVCYSSACCLQNRLYTLMKTDMDVLVAITEFEGVEIVYME